MSQYRVVKNNIIRAILSHYDTNHHYLSPSDVKGALNFRRTCLDKIKHKIATQGCFPEYVRAKYNLEDDINYLENVKIWI